MRNQRTEDFSGLPYLYALLNCLICAWYGTPFMSDDNLLVTTVNTIGAMFQLTYVILYIVYAEKSKKVVYPCSPKSECAYILCINLLLSIIFCYFSWFKYIICLDVTDFSF